MIQGCVMTDLIQILLVDDEKELCELIRRGLTRYSPQYRINLAFDGKQALEIIKNQDLDIIITDIRMPDINGLELLKQAIEIQPDLQSIVITGHGDLDKAIEALRLNVLNFFRKPVSVENLHYSIQRGYEKKILTGKLAASEENYQILTNTLIDLIFRTDNNGGIRYVNLSCLDQLKYTQEQLIGKKMVQLIAEPHQDIFYQWQQAGSNTTPDNQYIQIDLCDSTGLMIPVEIGMSKILENNQSAGFLLVARNISERIQAEKEIRDTTRQLRNLSVHLQSIREEERTMIAREVHDELGQTLTAMKLDLSWLRKKLPDDQKSLQDKTNDVMVLTDQTLSAVRRICSELRPGLLDDLGLSAALEWQVEEFRRRTGIHCQLTMMPEDMGFDADLSISIFRVIQESLVNITRHAKAENVHIRLVHKDGTLDLTIQDDGIGIDENKISDPHSHGLIGIRERVIFWGGKVFFKDNNGTRVSVIIPDVQVNKL